MRNLRSFAKQSESERSPSIGRRPSFHFIRNTLISCTALVWFWTAIGQSVQPYSKTFYYSGQPSNTLNSTKACLKTDQGLYLVIGNANNAIGQYFTVVKIDNAGNSLNQISIQHPVHRILVYPTNAIIEDSKGDIVVATTIGRVTENPYDGFLAKLTPDLDTLWTRTYDLPPTLAGCPADTFVGNYFTAIRQTPDGGYIIAGNYRLNCQPGTISDRACLLKVDTAGEVEWWQVYPNHHSIFDVEVAPDSGFVFLEVDDPGFRITKANKYGNLLWQSVLDNTHTHKFGQDVEFVNDSIVAIAGIYVYDDTPAIRLRGIDFYLFNVKSKSILSAHSYIPYTSIRCATLHQNLKLQPLDDGFIIAATGTVVAPDSSQTQHKGVLFKLDNNGDSVWVRYYQYGDFHDQCQFNDVLVMDDGGFLAVGFHFPWTVNAGAWLVRTDSNGYAPGAYPTGIFKPEPMVSELKLYPNPSSGISWLELDAHSLPHSSRLRSASLNSGGQASTLKLFNINGKLVQSTPLPPGTQVQEINTQNLPSGLYLVNLVFEDGKVFSGKLVVR